jgi:hypothetical protein
MHGCLRDAHDLALYAGREPHDRGIGLEDAMAIELPFASGQIVVLVLRDPRERIWGRLLGIETAGVAVRGLDLMPWEDVLALVKRGESDQVSLATRFYPMYRIESLYLDEPSSGVPSLIQDFKRRTGQDAQAFLADRLDG